MGRHAGRGRSRIGFRCLGVAAQGGRGRRRSWSSRGVHADPKRGHVDAAAGHRLRAGAVANVARWSVWRAIVVACDHCAHRRGEPTRLLGAIAADVSRRTRGHAPEPTVALTSVGSACGWADRLRNSSAKAGRSWPAPTSPRPATVTDPCPPPSGGFGGRFPTGVGSATPTGWRCPIPISVNAQVPGHTVTVRPAAPKSGQHRASCECGWQSRLGSTEQVMPEIRTHLDAAVGATQPPAARPTKPRLRRLRP